MGLLAGNCSRRWSYTVSYHVRPETGKCYVCRYGLHGHKTSPVSYEYNKCAHANMLMQRVIDAPTHQSPRSCVHFAGSEAVPLHKKLVQLKGWCVCGRALRSAYVAWRDEAGRKQEIRVQSRTSRRHWGFHWVGSRSLGAGVVPPARTRVLFSTKTPLNDVGLVP